MNRKMIFFNLSTLLTFCFISILGCAPVINKGKDFNSSVRTDIVLDKTNKDQVVKLFGIPEKISTVLINGLNYEEYQYLFLKGNYPSYFDRLRRVRPKKPYMRALSIDFMNDRVQNYQFFSTFPEEFITFNQSLIEKIIVNKTNESDLITMFGPPHGKSMVTAAKISPGPNIENAVTIWSYRGMILSQNNEETVKSLALYLDNKGVVIKKTFE